MELSTSKLHSVGVVRGIRETDFLNNIIIMMIISFTFTCIFTVISSSLFLDVDIWSLIIDELDIWSIRIFLVRVFLLCFGLNSNRYVNKTLRLMLKYSHLLRWRNDGKFPCVGRGANVCDQSALAHACVYGYVSPPRYRIYINPRRTAYTAFRAVVLAGRHMEVIRARRQSPIRKLACGPSSGGRVVG